MKRTLLLSLALTLFTCAYAAVGDTFVLDNVTYIVKSDNTVGIKKADSKVTSFNLTDQVTNEGTTYTVVSVEDYAFQYSEATALTLPSTITSIGYSAFSSCKAASIILPKNLKTIGNYAFYAVRNITSIEIPEGVEALGTNKYSSAFGTCYALKSIKLPSTLKTIWNSTFYNCGLESVEIPEGTTFIGKNAFNHCQKLTTVTLPSTLDSIDGRVWRLHRPHHHQGCNGWRKVDWRRGVLQLPTHRIYRSCRLRDYRQPRVLKNQNREVQRGCWQHQLQSD